MYTVDALPGLGDDRADGGGIDIGLDLGGRSPEETALSIIAEVVAVKNGRSGASLRATSGRIGRE